VFYGWRNIDAVLNNCICRRSCAEKPTRTKIDTTGCYDVMTFVVTVESEVVITV
jgi:hypothetical protein